MNYIMGMSQIMKFYKRETQVVNYIMQPGRKLHGGWKPQLQT